MCPGLLVARAAAQLATFDRCEVRVEALERGGGCLAVDAAAINATLAPPEGTAACDDSATWTDGTNGCAKAEAAAARGDDWCDEFGSLGASDRVLRLRRRANESLQVQSR